MCRRILLPALLLFLFFYQAKAQHRHTWLYDAPKNSIYTYIFKVSKEEFVNIYKEDYFLLDGELLHTLVDSFLTSESPYQKQLPPGNYIEVKTEGNQLKSHTLSVTDFYPEHIRINGRSALMIINRKGEPVTDLTVKVDGRAVRFMPVEKAFMLPDYKQPQVLTIESENVVVVRKNEKEERYFGRRRNWLRRMLWKLRPFRKEIDVRGYIVVSQPKYKPGDTVKIKAFLLTHEGKKFKRPLLFEISTGYRASALHAETISPSANGSYLLNFAISDSFQLGSHYNVFVSESSKSKYDKYDFPTTSFAYEDYQLDEIVYKVSMNNDVNKYSVGDSIQFFFKGLDHNGLPVMDARVKLAVTHLYGYSTRQAIAYMPDTIWTYEGMLDTKGKHEICLPDSMIPAAIFTARVYAQFINSNNEITDTSFTISIDHVKKPAKMIREGSEILITAETGGDTEGILSSSKRYGSHIESKKIKLPHMEMIHLLADEYIFTSAKGTVRLKIDQPSQVIMNAYRTVDSVFVKMYNPSGIRVCYAVYEDKKLLFKNCGDTLTYKGRAKGYKTYTVDYSFFLGGQFHNEKAYAYRASQKLNVQIEQPEMITPGENVTVKIRVKDEKGLPVKNVNLTAASLNAQFKQPYIPSMPYYGKIRYNRKEKRYNAFSYTNDDHTNYWMDEDILRMLHLDTMLYYRFIKPGREPFCYYERVGSTEVSPYVFSYGSREDVHAVYVDDKMMFTTMSDAKPVYSFRVTPGYHRIRLRTRTTVYEIDSVLVREGEKLEMSVPYSRNSSRIKLTEVKPVLSDDEKNELHKNMLQLNLKGETNVVYVWNGDVVYRIEPRNWGNGHYVVGPLEPFHEYHITIQNKFERSLIFEPGYEYDFTDTYMVKTKQVVNTELQKFDYGVSNKITHGLLAQKPEDVVRVSGKSDRNSLFLDNLPASVYTGHAGLMVICQDRIEGMSISYGNDTWFIKKDDEFNGLQQGSYEIICYYFNHLVKKVKVDLKSYYTTIVNMDSFTAEKPDTLDSRWTAVFGASHSSIFKAGKAGIRGKVLDEKTGGPVDFVLVTLSVKNFPITNAFTDEEGNFYFTGLGKGLYSVEVSSIGTNPVTADVMLPDSGIVSRVIRIDQWATDLKEVTVRGSRGPVNPEGKGGIVITSKEIQRLPQRNVNMVANLTAGVSSRAGNAYYIDGVRVMEASMAPQNATGIDALYISEGAWKDVAPEAGGKGKSIRNNFKDVAYWMPDLITNDSGFASFGITFPDNLTSWRSYVVAMDKKSRTGMDFSEVRAFKKVTASLYVPRFLVEGDEYTLSGKTNNYTSISLLASTVFKVNDKVVKAVDVTVDKVFTEQVSEIATTTDTIKASYFTKLENGYEDGEEEKIPVLKQGMIQTEGAFFILDHDTAFTVKALPGKGAITLHAQPLLNDVLLDEIALMRKYPYECNEQLASKLLAVLYEKQILETSGKHFGSDNYTKNLIRKLERNKQTNGFWSWWKNEGQASYWVSSHVIHALLMAAQNGFKVKAFDNDPRSMALQALPHLDSREQLQVLYMLHQMNMPFEYEHYLAKISTKNEGLYEQLLRLSITGINNRNDSSVIAKNQRINWSGSLYWGEERYHTYAGINILTAMVYEIISKANPEDKRLAAIERYLLEQRQHAGWANTYESVKVMGVLLNRVKSNASESKDGLNIQLAGSSYRLAEQNQTLRIPEGQTATVSKTGNDLMYFTSYQEYHNQAPLKKEGEYSVHTHFVNEKKERIDSLPSGALVEMIVEVDMKNKGEYITIEVPIPAGCTYGNNSLYAGLGNVHYEFFKYKTVILCEKLEPGKHTFPIALHTRFAGLYTVNPAKVELMYFPVFNGNNTLTKMRIR